MSLQFDQFSSRQASARGFSVSPVLTQDCSATSGSSAFNNSIINIKCFTLLTADPELGYRVNDDVSLLSIAQVEAFIF